MPASSSTSQAITQRNQCFHPNACDLKPQMS